MTYHFFKRLKSMFVTPVYKNLQNESNQQRTLRTHPKLLTSKDNNHRSPSYPNIGSGLNQVVTSSLPFHLHVSFPIVDYPGSKCEGYGLSPGREECTWFTDASARSTILVNKSRQTSFFIGILSIFFRRDRNSFLWIYLLRLCWTGRLFNRLILICFV